MATLEAQEPTILVLAKMLGIRVVIRVGTLLTRGTTLIIPISERSVEESAASQTDSASSPSCLLPAEVKTNESMIESCSSPDYTQQEMELGKDFFFDLTETTPPSQFNPP